MGARAPVIDRLRCGGFKCDFCGRSLLTLEKLRSHERTLHAFALKNREKAKVSRARHSQNLQKFLTGKPKPVKVVASKIKVIKMPSEKTAKLPEKRRTTKVKTARKTVNPETKEVQMTGRKVEFKCPKCDEKNFSVFFSASKHIQKYHCENKQGKTVDPTSKDLIKPIRVEVCLQCHCNVTSEPHLCKDSPDEEEVIVLYKCIGCNRTFPSIKLFDIHVSGMHSDSVESMFFPNEEEFTNWKQEMEENTETTYNYHSTKYSAKQMFRCANSPITEDGDKTTAHFCPSTIVYQEYPKEIAELQTIISRMPLEVCCVTVLPELGVRWREVSRAVRNSRLPMQPSSVARVLCRHAAKSLSADDAEDVVARLRLKLIATQERNWHVVTLSDPTDEEVSVAHLIRALPSRVAQELKRTKAGRSMQRPEVQTVMLGDLLYLSVQMVSESKEGATLYVATPPGEAVALVSSLASSLLKACVLGLGYKTYTNAKLFGRDVRSLLRIHDGGWEGNPEHLGSLPEYNPVPVVTTTGVDFTHKAYNEMYVQDVIGPDPPHLTTLHLTASQPFFAPSLLTRRIALSVRARSSDVAASLRAWVRRGALAPTSRLLRAISTLKTNKIEYTQEDE